MYASRPFIKCFNLTKSTKDQSAVIVPLILAKNQTASLINLRSIRASYLWAISLQKLDLLVSSSLKNTNTYFVSKWDHKHCQIFQHENVASKWNSSIGRQVLSLTVTEFAFHLPFNRSGTILQNGRKTHVVSLASKEAKELVECKNIYLSMKIK